MCNYMYGPGEAHRGTLAHSSGEQVRDQGALAMETWYGHGA
jgi:hypothetical protein